MLKYLFLAFTIIPIAELYLLITVGGQIGLMPTLGLVLFTGFAGAWLARQQGFSTMIRVQQSMAQGRMPAEELVDAMLIFGAGVVLLTPGFITDVMGLLLLIPYTRNLFKLLVKKRFLAMKEQGTITVEATVIRPGGQDSRQPSREKDQDVIDVEPRKP